MDGWDGVEEGGLKESGGSVCCWLKEAALRFLGGRARVDGAG